MKKMIFAVVLAMLALPGFAVTAPAPKVAASAPAKVTKTVKKTKKVKKVPARAKAAASAAK